MTKDALDFLNFYANSCVLMVQRLARFHGLTEF